MVFGTTWGGGSHNLDGWISMLLSPVEQGLLEGKVDGMIASRHWWISVHLEGGGLIILMAFRRFAIGANIKALARIKKSTMEKLRLRWLGISWANELSWETETPTHGYAVLSSTMKVLASCWMTLISLRLMCLQTAYGGQLKSYTLLRLDTHSTDLHYKLRYIIISLILLLLLHIG